MRFDALWQDVKYAVRGLRKKPGFAITVVLTLGLGIGANAAIFGITDRLLFRAPSFMKDPDRVHREYLVRTWDGKENHGAWFQYTRFKDLTRWTSSFDVTAAMSDAQLAVGVGDNAREMRIGAVSAGYWSLFEARPETLVALFDKHVREARAAIAKSKDSDYDVPWSLKMGEQVLFTAPRGTVVRQHINHFCHHRGQLTVYLRLLDVPIPSIYGPTADEHM